MTTVGVFAAVQDDRNRYLCVRHNYGQHDWGMPGGRLEAGEDPVACVKREIYEETGTEVEVTHLVGAYSAPYKDDLALLFAARLVIEGPWSPSDEISEVGFFQTNALPEPMAPNPRCRFADVAAGVRGVARTFCSPGIFA